MILSQYFKAIEREANLDPTEYKSIAELTKEIATRAGWTRQLITQKNGKQVIKTVYTNRKTVTVRKNGKLEEVSAINYDSILCAKWYMYFKKHFMFKLSMQKNLNEYFDYILTETFHAVFSSLDLNKNITELSGGEKQKVALIRNLLFKPEVLLLDEITTGLDNDSKEIVHRLIQNVHKDNTTIIQVTHDNDEIHQAGQIIKVAEGKLVK